MPPRPSDKMLLVSSSFLAQAMRIGATLVMARLLTPRDYGLYALVIALPGLITSMNDIGISRAMVQMRDRPQDQVIHTALALNLIIYLVYGLLFAGGGAYLAWREDDGRLLVLGVLVAVTAFLAAIYQFQMTCLWRERSFAVEARQNLIFAVASLVTGITLAATGWGVYALALQALIAQLVANLAIFRVAPLPKPTAFSRDTARSFFRFGWATTAATYLGNVRGSILSLMIDRLFGPDTLGKWGRAVQVQQLFGQNLMVPLERVVYPTLCASLDDRQRLGEVVRRALTMHLIVALPAMMWLMTNAPDAVMVVFGDQWNAVGQLAQILAIAIPAGAVMSIGYSLWHALGKTGFWLRLAIADFILTMGAFGFIALRTSRDMVNVDGTLELIALTWVLSQYFVATIAIWRGVRFIGMTWPRGLLTMISLSAAMVAAEAGFILAKWPVIHGVDGWPDWMVALLRMTLSTIGGASAYLSVIWIADREVLRDAWQLATRRGNPAG